MTRTRAVAIAVSFILVGCSAADDTTGESSIASVATVAPIATVPGETAPPTVPSESTAPEVTAPLVAESVVLTRYVDGFQGPVDLAWRIGDPAIYVVDQPGVITPIVDGVSGAPVVDITDLVSCCGEQGLLGLAFHPTEALAYVNYTNTDGDTVVAEFTIGADGIFDEASRRTVITINQPYPNHNGGDVAFGFRAT